MSGRTREIEVWVHPNLLNDNWNGKTFAVLDKEHNNSIRARLILELPERKVELTESMFFEIVRDFKLHEERKNGPLLGSHREPASLWHEKLFGKC